MAKRFTDTEKWKRPWFAKLSQVQKLVWIYVLDECDHAGVWHANFERLSFDLGTTFSEVDFEQAFRGKVRKLEEDKYLIRSFIEFQYGRTLNPKNNAHRKAIEFLQSLPPDSAPLPPPLLTPCSGPPKILRGPQGAPVEEEVDKEVEVEVEVKGGLGETKSAAPTTELSGSLQRAVKIYEDTLLHFKCARPLRERERLRIARALQEHGETSLILALQGPRQEKASKDYDPSQYLSLERILDPKKYSRFENLGAQYAEAHATRTETAQGSAIGMSPAQWAEQYMEDQIKRAQGFDEMEAPNGNRAS